MQTPAFNPINFSAPLRPDQCMLVKVLAAPKVVFSAKQNYELQNENEIDLLTLSILSAQII